MPADPRHASHARPPLFAIALVSATALAYEVLLIRLFSIIQWHHFAYMIISLALLGYAASGSFLAFFQARLLARYPAAFLANLALFGVSLTPCFLLAQTISFNPEELLWDWRQLWRLAPVYLLLSLPFFFAANAIALTLARFRPVIARIYAIDLLGAGAGSLVIVLLLYSLIPLHTLTVVSICGSGCLAFAAFDMPLKRRKAVIAVTLLLIAINVGLGLHGDLKLSLYKDLSQAQRVTGAEVIETLSSPLALLDVVENRAIPPRFAAGMSINSVVMPPRQLALFADGNTIGAITRNDGSRASLAFLDQLTAALPYHLKPAQRVLILGSGGGLEVLQAIYQNVGRIDAVELNPQITGLIEEQFSEFSGNLYHHPGVNLRIDAARGFIHSTDTRYDLVVVPPGDGAGAASAGLYALSENYLYTVEALQNYLDRLDDGGYLALPQSIQFPPRNTLRLFATAVQALRNNGVTTPGDHLLLVRGWQTSSLLVKNTAFTPDELAALRSFCESRAFDLAWIPGIRETETNRFNRLREAYFFNAATQLLAADNRSFIAGYKFNIEPTSDDRPYFNHFLKWSTLNEILALREQGGLALLDAGYPVLLATLLQALLFSALLIVLPLRVLQRRRLNRHSGTHLLPVTLYFGAIGLAFLFIEIAFIQKFTLFLHHPVVTVSVILATFLVFAGLGSLWSKRHTQTRDAQSQVLAPVLAIVTLGLVYLLLIDDLFAALSAWPLPAKAAASIVTVAPLAFCMGIPFPVALMRLAARTPALIPFAWGVNGCASVLSAVLATLLAIHFGFSVVVLLALALYLLAAWSLPGPA